MTLEGQLVMFHCQLNDASPHVKESKDVSDPGFQEVDHT